MWHWLQVFFGFAPGDSNSPAYLAWSGIVGDLTLLGAALAVIRHGNCHQRRCWRLGRHLEQAGRNRWCHRHMPPAHAEPLTAELAGLRADIQELTDVLRGRAPAP